MTDKFIKTLEYKISKCDNSDLLKRLIFIIDICKKEIIRHDLDLRLENIEGEQWVPILNFEGSYEISNKGRVKSLSRKNTLNQTLPCKILKQNKVPDGHKVVCIYKNKIGYRHSVHALVASHFIDNPLHKPMVNHINGIPFCNELWNLEWATAAENNKHAHQIGANFAQKEDGHRFAKLKKEDVLYIISCNKFQAELALAYNISQATISDIRRGKSWSSLTGIKFIKNKN